jgi:hypothetical protein
VTSRSQILLGALSGLAWAAGLRGPWRRSSTRARASAGLARSATSCSPACWSGCSWVGPSIFAVRVAGAAGAGWPSHPYRFAAILFSQGARWGSSGPSRTACAVERSAYLSSPWQAGTPSLRVGAAEGHPPCGALALTAIPIRALTVESLAGADLTVTTPRGLWVPSYYHSFLALFMIAAALPHRPTVAKRRGGCPENPTSCGDPQRGACQPGHPRNPIPIR